MNQRRRSGCLSILALFAVFPLFNHGYDMLGFLLLLALLEII